LGLSLAKGLVNSGEFIPNQFHLSRRRINKLSSFKAEGYEVTSDNIFAAKNATLVIICVLPQKINAVLEELKTKLTSNQLVISLVSGVSISEIQEIIGTEIPIIRAMPNTAIAIRESMTCISTIIEWENRLNEVEKLFNLVGETAIINEEKMTSATALCACGIAFFLRAIRAASQGGNEIDFHASEALKMAAQTAKGAAGLLLTNGSHPEDEIDKVTSPKGCTIAGLNEMEHNGFSSAFIKGITISANKAKELY
jgi:pyrroline-5-carboxylate reductase